MGTRGARTRSTRHGSRVPRSLAVLKYLGQIALASIAVAAAGALIVPKVMGWQGVIVLTGSMEPALDTGGVAFVDRVPAEDIHVGDVMTFTRAGSRQQVTHRVTAVTATSEGPRFRTKGDVNDIPDSWTVTPGQVVGKVRFALPHLGGLVHLLVGNQRLLGLLMAVPAAFLVADEFRRWRRERGVVRRWLDEDRVRVPVVDDLLPPLALVSDRPRRTRARPATLGS
jgi:signal peptidase